MELVRYLTIGSINRYRLRGRTATDPTVNPLIGSKLLGKPRTICEYTRIPVYVKCFVKIIFGALCMTVQIAEKALWERVSYRDADRPSSTLDTVISRANPYLLAEDPDV